MWPGGISKLEIESSGSGIGYRGYAISERSKSKVYCQSIALLKH